MLKKSRVYTNALEATTSLSDLPTIDEIVPQLF